MLDHDHPRLTKRRVYSIPEQSHDQLIDMADKNIQIDATAVTILAMTVGEGENE